MSNHRVEQEYDSDDLLMSDDLDLLDDTLEDDEQEHASARSRIVDIDMRHRIEARLEERRLQKELNEYDALDLDDDDVLH